MKYWNSKTIYRKIILILTGLQFLGFFILPYADMYTSLNKITEFFGRYTGVTFPEHLTGYSMMRLMLGIDNGDGPFLVVMMIMMIVVLLMHVIGKGRMSYVGSLLAEGVVLLFETIFVDAAESIKGYSQSGWSIFIILLCVAIEIVSLLGIVLEKRAQVKIGTPKVKGDRKSIDTEKLAKGLGTAGNIAAALAKKGGEQLAKVPGAVRSAVDSAQNASASSAKEAKPEANIPKETSMPKEDAPKAVSTDTGRAAVIPQSGFLTGVKGMFAGAQIPVGNGEEIILGRSSEVCHLVLTGQMISRKHCVVRYDGGTGNYLVTDFSENGTYTGNGNRLPSEKQVALTPGTVLWIGNQENTFQLG